MKMKNILLLSAILLLLFSGCVMEPDNTKQPGNDPVTPGTGPVTPGTDPVVTPGKYGTEFRGEWIRIDNGDRWYISGSAITVNGNNSQLSVSLARTSENVVTATAGGSTYTLFAARTANASFNAQVWLLDGETASQSTARDFIGNNGRKPPIKVKNPKQPDLPPVTVQPDADTGEFEVAGVIPGDEIEIIPDDTEWEDTTVTVTPGFGEGQNMGTIPLTHGDNYKVSIRPAETNGTDDTGDLYADEKPQDYVIELENIGEANSGDGDIEVSWNDADFSLAGGRTVLEYANIPPKTKKALPISLSSKAIQAEQKIKELKIHIRNYESVSRKIKEWEDTVSVNYYNTAVPFRFRSEKEVQGVIKSKKGKSYYFQTKRTDSGNFAAEVKVPWSAEEYIIAFLGASVESGNATKYSFGVNAFPSVRWSDLSIPGFLREYKPRNEKEETAPVIDLSAGTQIFMGYLAGDSIDYYRVKLGDTPPAFIPDGPIAVGIDNLAEQLAALPAPGEYNPATIQLEPLTFTTSPTVKDGITGFAQINNIVRNAQKYVILDLSACTAEGNTVTGYYPPSDNDMNIIQYNNYVKGVILPANLKTIGNDAFHNCYYLSDITIPPGVTAIGNSAFADCTGLSGITIPDSVTSIGNNAFYGSSGLNTVTFKGSGVTIGENAFGSYAGSSGYYYISYNNALREAYAKEGAGTYRLTEEGGWAKEGGPVAALIADLAGLGDTGADSPATVTILATNISDIWGRINDIVKKAQKYVTLDLSNCTADGNAIVGNSGTPSGNEMNIIKDNQYIRGIVLPSTLQTIGNYTFYNCYYLKSITIPESVSSVGSYIFSDTHTFTNVYTKGGAGTYTRTGNDDWAKEDGSIPALIKDLAALSGTSESGPKTVKLAATDITNKLGRINSAVQSAEKYVIIDLSDCTTEGNTITNDGGFAKYNEYIKGIILPSTLETIKEYAFHDYEYLTSLTFPASITSPGSYAFGYCDNLSSVTFKGSGGSAFGIPGNIAAAYYAEGAGTYIKKPNGLNDDWGNPISTWVKEGGTLVALIQDLAALSGTSASSPKTVKVAATGISYNWDEIMLAVANAQKYVILDISGCTFNGNRMSSGIKGGSEYIKSIILPSTLETIGDGNFSVGNSSLTSITIPGSVTSIGAYAFQGCSGLTEITIPDSVTSIGMQTFYGCSSLASVTVHGNITSIGKKSDYDWPFYGPNKSVTITSNLNYKLSSLFNPDYITSLVLADGVTSIGENAFSGYKNLTSVTISESVSSIGSNAFSGDYYYGSYGNGSVVKVTFNGSSTVIDDNAFNPSNNALREAYTAGGAGTYRKIANDYWEKDGSYIAVFIEQLRAIESVTDAANPATVKLAATNISDKWGKINSAVMFAGKYVTLDLSDCTADGNAMNVIYNNQYVKGIILPSSLQTIGNYAFQYCSNLTSVTIPDSVTSVGNYAFSDCSGLTEITIPNSVTSIGANAFNGCSNLTSVSFKKSGIQINTTAPFPGNLREVYIAEGAGTYRTIGQTNWEQEGNYLSAFMEQLRTLQTGSSYNATPLKLAKTVFSTSSVVPEGAIGWGKINTVVLDAKKYVILDLSDCTAYGNTISGYGDTINSAPSGNVMNIIMNNEYITNIILPSSLKTIGNSAFESCRISSLTIPASVTSIGAYVFYRCGVTSITFEKSGVSISTQGDHYYLQAAYTDKKGGAGTYTRSSTIENWTKQP